MNSPTTHLELVQYQTVIAAMTALIRSAKWLPSLQCKWDTCSCIGELTFPYPLYLDLAVIVIVQRREWVG